MIVTSIVLVLGLLVSSYGYTVPIAKVQITDHGLQGIIPHRRQIVADNKKSGPAQGHNVHRRSFGSEFNFKPNKDDPTINPYAPNNDGEDMINSESGYEGYRHQYGGFHSFLPYPPPNHGPYPGAYPPPFGQQHQPFPGHGFNNGWGNNGNGHGPGHGHGSEHGHGHGPEHGHGHGPEHGHGHGPEHGHGPRDEPHGKPLKNEQETPCLNKLPNENGHGQGQGHGNGFGNGHGHGNGHGNGRGNGHGHGHGYGHGHGHGYGYGHGHGYGYGHGHEHDMNYPNFGDDCDYDSTESNEEMHSMGPFPIHETTTSFNSIPTEPSTEKVTVPPLTEKSTVPTITTTESPVYDIDVRLGGGGN